MSIRPILCRHRLGRRHKSDTEAMNSPHRGEWPRAVSARVIRVKDAVAGEAALPLKFSSSHNLFRPSNFVVLPQAKLVPVRIAEKS